MKKTTKRKAKTKTAKRSNVLVWTPCTCQAHVGAKKMFSFLFFKQHGSMSAPPSVGLRNRHDDDDDDDDVWGTNSKHSKFQIRYRELRRKLRKPLIFFGQ